MSSPHQVELAARLPQAAAMNALEQALEAVVERVVRRVVREELAAGRAGPALAPELVTMKEFARRLSICEGTVRAAIREGRLQAVKIGRAVRVRANAQIGKPVTRADTPVVRARQIVGRYEAAAANHDKLGPATVAMARRCGGRPTSASGRGGMSR